MVRSRVVEEESACRVGRAFHRWQSLAGGMGSWCGGGCCGLESWNTGSGFWGSSAGLAAWDGIADDVTPQGGRGYIKEGPVFQSQFSPPHLPSSFPAKLCLHQLAAQQAKDTRKLQHTALPTFRLSGPQRFPSCRLPSFPAGLPAVGGPPWVACWLFLCHM